MSTDKEFNFVTTFGTQHAWGHDMVASCDKFLPDNCKITVYLDADLPEDRGRVEYKRLPEERVSKFINSIQPYRDLKIPPTEKIMTKEYINKVMYLWDASRFCFKMFAMDESAKTQEERYMVWCDADVLFHKSVSKDFLESLVQTGKYVSYLDRKTRHSETGFLIYNTKHPYHKTWWSNVRKMYDDLGLVNLKEGWTDSHVFDHILNLSVETGMVEHVKISDGAKNAWDESPLKDYCKHYKGMQADGEHGANK